MQIKDIIAQVRAKMPAEVPAEINTLLSEIEREGETLLADRTAANNESKERKGKIRELEANIEAQKAELEAATKKAADIEKEKTELRSYKDKWEVAKAERETANKTKWDDIKKKFDVKETDKEFDQIAKLKKYYTLTDDPTPEQVEQNLNMANQHSELGLFSISGNPPPNTPRGTEDNPGGLKTISQYNNPG